VSLWEPKGALTLEGEAPALPQDGALTAQAPARSDEDRFIEAGLLARHNANGSVYTYRKSPQKMADGGEIVIREEPLTGGDFSVISEYEKNHIMDGRRRYAVTVQSVDEALAAVASFEKQLLPGEGAVREETAPSPGLRMR
jgi:hypothetical protein